MHRVWLIILALCPWTLATRIQVSPEGGYFDITIAIDQDIDEDQEIVDQIKELLTEASEFLYVATKGTLFFEEVTIALPPTWNHKPGYENSLKNNIKDADVVVASHYTDEPLTIQPGGCGEHGLNIHLTPNYLRNMREPASVDKSGVPGKRFVQEWAKFRYGVFEEFVTEEMEKDRRFKRYYDDDSGKKKPSTCTAKIGEQVFYLNKKGQPCDPNENTAGCYYRLFNDYVNENASLMFTASFDSVNTFCDERNHNKRAPNKHNILCSYQSVWKVISSHKDFKIAPIANVFRPRNTVPNFSFVRTIKDSGKTVLILDISGSMGFFNQAPIKLLHQTATSHILEFIPDGSEVGIVVFGTNAKTVHPMTKVDNSTRKSLAAAIPIKADGGGTAIGKGLMEGLEVLKRSGIVEGGVLLLITDGEENESPKIIDVKDTLLEERVVISVIAYGEKADKQLEALALETGGRASFFRDINNTESANSQQLNEMMLQASTAQADVKFEPVRLKSTGFVLHTQETKDTVFLDHELGKNTVFYFSWTYNASPEIELISPSGTVYNWQSQGTFYLKDNNKIRFKFEDAETGFWTIIIRKRLNENPDISFTLVSEPKDPRKQPVRVKSWMSNVEIDPLAKKSSARIYAKVTKNDVPVLNATVVAVISGPGSSSKVQLSDDGKGVDISEDDGIYTGVATMNTFKGNGRFTVRARVTSKKGASLKLRRKYKGRKKTHGKRNKRLADVAIEELTVGDYDDSKDEESAVDDNKSIRLPNIARLHELDLLGDSDDLDREINLITSTQPTTQPVDLSPDDGGNANETAIDEDYDEDFDEEFEEVSLDPFERDEDAGTIIVSNWTPDLKDTSAPSRVSDLILVNDKWEGDEKHITLSWTESGDDFNQGVATSIEIRESNVLEELIDHFDKTLPRTDFLDGNLVPGNPGEVKNVTISVTSAIPYNRSYFALKYIDEAGNKGDVSNFVTVSLVKPLDICQREGGEICSQANGFCVLDNSKALGYFCNCSYGIPLQNDGEVCTDICTAKGKHLCSNVDADCIINEPENITFSCLPRKDSCELNGTGVCAVFGASCVVDQSDKFLFSCECPLGQSKDSDGVCADACALIGNEECSKADALCFLNITDNSTYICECPMGLTFDTDGTCADVCQTKGHELCAYRGATCQVNEANNSTFNCECPAGLSFNKDGKCANVCELEGDSHCSTKGARCYVNDEDPLNFTCICPVELSFNDDNECVNACELLGQNHCSTLRANCVLNGEDNSTFRCECPAGLKPGEDDKCMNSCELLGQNHCSTLGADCVLNEEDNSTFRCECPAGLKAGDDHKCKNACELLGDDYCLTLGASCILNEEDNATYRCECPAGLKSGKDDKCMNVCELHGDDYCSTLGATCILDEEYNSTYRCECPIGLSPDEDDKCLNACELFGENHCLTLGASCILNEEDNSTFRCECPAGLKAGDDHKCKNACELLGDDYCLTLGASCILNEEDNATYRCECPAGLNPGHDDKCMNACEQLGDVYCSTLGASCILNEESFVCECPKGLKPSENDTCVDACEQNGHNHCLVLGASCVLNEADNSTFRCECPKGFKPGKDQKCMDVCEIEGNDFCINRNGICVVLDRDNEVYNCKCAAGLFKDENQFCVDICKIMGDRGCAPLKAKCVVSKNENTTFYCECPPGLYENPMGICGDICEAEGDLACGDTNAECRVNQTDNSTYYCECPASLFPDSDSKCVDICKIEGDKECSKIRANCVPKTPDNSSYDCECYEGLTLNENGLCENACEREGNVECAKNNARCVLELDCSCTDILCTTTQDSSRYNCQCNRGFTADEKGICHDICYTKGTVHCKKANATCEVLPDDETSYSCKCPSGLDFNKEGVCSDSCELTGDELCQKMNAICVLDNKPSTFTCQCPPGLKFDSNDVCSDICSINGTKECSKLNAECVIDSSNPLKYDCQCSDGYSKSKTTGACVDVCESTGNEVCALLNAKCSVSPNEVSTYSCDCNANAYPDAKGVCSDACTVRGDKECASRNAKCVLDSLDEKGYFCDCPIGLFRNRNGACSDICEAKGKEICQLKKAVCQIDSSYPRVFTCKCRAPFSPGPNGKCTDKEVDVQIYDKNQTVLQGQKVIFRCRDEGRKRLDVKWTRKNGRALPSLSTDHLGELTIRYVQPGDSGIYICHVTNAPNRKGYKKRAKLRVLPVNCPPNTFQCRGGICIDSNKRCDQRKDCPGADSSDELYCSWRGGTRPGSRTTVYREIKTTTPSPFTPYKYLPLMDDPNRVSNVNVKLYDSEQVVTQGGNAIFRCRDEGPRRFPVEWSRLDGLPLPRGSVVDGTRLKIVNVQPSDGGSYICKAVGASDIYGDASQVAVLKVNPCQGYFCSFVN